MTEQKNTKSINKDDSLDSATEEAPKRRGRPPSKKKASKKKAAKSKSVKKKATKKKASKKRGKKKASAAAQPEIGSTAVREPVRKKKSSKKKRSKKKQSRTSSAVGAASDPYARLMNAAQEIQAAITDLAETRFNERTGAVADVKRIVKAKLEEFEQEAVRTLRKLSH